MLKNESNSKNMTIEWMKTFGTILVVLGHSAFYVLETNISTMKYDVSELIIDGSYIHKLFSAFVSLIYTSHMQFFMLSSGMVLSLCMQENKYKTFRIFFKKKTSNLLLPYAAITIFFNIPVYWATGFFENSSLNCFLYFMGYGNNHLWYLCTLFMVSVIAYYAYRWQVNRMLFFVAVGLWIISEGTVIPITELLYLNRVPQYLFWFLLGMEINKYRLKIFDIFECKKNICVIAGLLWIAVFVVNYRINTVLMTMVTRLIGVLFLLWFSLITEKIIKLDGCGLFTLINKNDRHIYYYGTPMSILCLHIVLFPKNGNQLVLGEISSCMLICFRVIVQVFLPILIARAISLLRKFTIWVMHKAAL